MRIVEEWFQFYNGNIRQRWPGKQGGGGGGVLIKGCDMFFEFENPKLTRHRRVTIRIQTFFGKEYIEEHNFQEDLIITG